MKKFLQEINFKQNIKTALDIGSSTGGFVQILLENNLQKVVALDVGSLQLHNLLRNDPRVCVFENTDIRDFKSDEKFDLVTCDISFISMTSILEYIVPFIKNRAIFLFKPQFEVGKDIKRDKRGVVKDEKAISMSRREFELKASKFGLILEESKECCIRGKEGNLEYFYMYKICDLSSY